MPKPQRSLAHKTGSRKNTVSWDQVDLGDSDEYSSGQDDLDSDFGSDDIYMSEKEGSDGDEAISEDNVVEEAITIPEEYLIAKSKDLNVESELAGDFERHYNAIAEKETSSQETWAFNFREDEFQDDIREVTGVGQGKSRKLRRVGGTHTGPKLSLEAQQAFGAANFAFVSGKTREAMQMFQEVIRMEPRHSPTWAALAGCHEQLGDHERALQIEIMAAHLTLDSEVWLNLARKSRDREFIQQSLYCYKKAAKLKPESAEIGWECANVCKENGLYTETVEALKRILKIDPHNITTINEILPLVFQLRDFDAAITILSTAFEYFQRIWPNGPPALNQGTTLDPTLIAQYPMDPNNMLQDFHIIALADAYIAAGKYHLAIQVIRDGARWLQGRRQEMEWIHASDDREFDIESYSRPDEDGMLTGETLKSGMHPLDVNLRHRLARARIKNGDIQEGKMHSEIVLREDVQIFGELFVEIADAFVEKSLFADALPIYELLLEGNTEVNIDLAMNAGACYRFLSRLDQAENMYSWVISIDAHHREAKLRLAEVYEMQNLPRKALALVYEVIDARKQEATALTRDETPSRDTPFVFGSKRPSLKRSTKRRPRDIADGLVSRRLDKQEIKRREEEKTTHLEVVFRKVVEQEKSLDRSNSDAVEGWLRDVSTLADDFRECKELFPGDKWSLQSAASKWKGLEGEEDQMASRLEAEVDAAPERVKSKPNLPTVYRNIPLSEWLSLFVKYAFILTSRNRAELAKEVLSHVSISYAYAHNKDPEAQLVLQIALMAIAVYTSNPVDVTTVGRRLVTDHQFNNEPYRLLLGCLDPGLRGTDALLNRTLTKWSLRSNRLWDMGVETAKLQRGDNPAGDENGNIHTDIASKTRGDGVVRWSTSAGRWVPVYKKKDGLELADEDDEQDNGNVEEGDKSQEPANLPTKRTPLGRIMQGVMLNASKTSHGALYYLFEAREVQQDDPLISLCLGVASLGRALGRRSDNRQQLIVQAVAFLEEYRKFRGSDNVATQEVEYNFGRYFHQLNLGAFAAKHYKRVLSLAEEWQTTHPEEPGLGPEAAYNLSLLYVLSGASKLAEPLYRRWLSI